jgi:hypothetical protein
MKKIFSFITIVLLAFICQNATAQNFSDILALKFASTTEYVNAVGSNDAGQLQSIDGFASYTSLESTKSNEQPPNDPGEEDDYDVSNDQPTFDKNDYFDYGLLSSILNSDKVVVIGNWICKVDLPNDRVLVLNKNNMSSYNDLLNGNISNSDILNFSTSDEVVDLLEQLDGGTPPSELDKIFKPCPDRQAAPKEAYRFFYNGNRHRIDAKVVYQRAGILFSLVAKGKTQKRIARIWWHDNNGNAGLSYIGLSFEVRCKPDKGFSYYGDPCQTGCLPGYEWGSTTVYRPYLGGTGLKSYFYRADFGSSSHGSGSLTIQD